MWLLALYGNKKEDATFQHRGMKGGGNRKTKCLFREVLFRAAPNLQYITKTEQNLTNNYSRLFIGRIGNGQIG